MKKNPGLFLRVTMHSEHLPYWPETDQFQIEHKECASLMCQGVN